jgi:hypothetical protein
MEQYPSLKLIVDQLVKKFLFFRGTQMLISVFMWAQN